MKIENAKRKDDAMNAAKKTTKKAENAGWLLARNRNGRCRVERLGWKRLAAIYAAARPGSAVRRAVNAEARRCGYTPSTILALNAE